ncbi:MAG: undecaprenyl-phosphate glucose phosphotransferase [Alteromonadaceae bacterium]|uniref:Exopolysaccharide biosynthesis glycosyltransferase VpsL n=1 Tax=Rheinheimera aquimaris TaxID=412437 RepID=A0ABN1DFT6_9GAMM|nr:undecaprenyl-phosphate glucose phosphotransferase [Rheinheimera aquimaris]MBJ91788.1 undecaprenyl-phosphate glucose phosphotransferase [Alteromonadaceae bacterium]MCB5212053.1 undecaprenyl-phosphate glucose phosphotransferase [Rheinheimera aquimaris]
MTNSIFRYEHSGSSVVYRLIDLMILVAVFLSCLYVYQVPFDKEYLLLLSASLAIYSYLAESVQLYRSWRAGRFSRMLVHVAVIHTVSFLLIVAGLFLLKEAETFSRLVLSTSYVAGLSVLILWRLVARAIKTWRRKRGLSLQQVAIIGLTPSGIALREEMAQHIELGFNCIGFYDDRTPERLEDMPTEALLGDVEAAVKMARRGKIAKLYICLPMMAEKRIADIISRLGDTTVDVLMVPEFLLKNLMHARIGNVGNIDTLSVFESPMFGFQSFYKRSFDLLFSSTVLLLISPLLILIALAVKLTSSGPVLFRQDRYGLDGKKIGVYKFRSMKVMENGGAVIQAKRNDKRITPVGAFLRRTSLDELPQFFNVLLGEMSVVGPRPHAVAHNEEYRKQVAFYMLRHKVRPGITGWAQINGWRGETDTLEKMEMRVKYDLDYIRNWSLLFDVSIVFKTVFKGFVDKNAY